MSLVVEPMPDIGVTRVSRWIFNSYVIHDGGHGPIVVDAGLPCAADDLEPILRDLAAPLQTVVATHAHSDHVAGVPRLAQRHGANIYLPAAAMPYLHGLRPRTPTPAHVAAIRSVLRQQPFDARSVLELVRGARIAGFGTPAGMRWSGPLPHGALADLAALPGAPDWMVVATPGHTDDSVTLYNPSTQTLLSGDAVLTVSGRAWHTPEVVDAAAASSSAALLRRLPVAHLLPGHGLPVHADSVWEHQR